MIRVKEMVIGLLLEIDAQRMEDKGGQWDI